MANMTWDEKIEKAKETALKKAQKEGLDEAATQAAVDEAVQKVLAAKAESESKAAAPKEDKWIVKVVNNPTYCGVGAGGVQFANGQAEITSARMAAWFSEHNGYDVKKA